MNAVPMRRVAYSARVIVAVVDIGCQTSGSESNVLKRYASSLPYTKDFWCRMVVVIILCTMRSALIVCGAKMMRRRFSALRARCV